MCHLAQVHHPDRTNEVLVSGNEFLVADNRTFSGSYPTGDSLDFFRNLMCGTVTPSFHHVLVRFPDGLRPPPRPDYYRYFLSLFGRISPSGTSDGLNAHVAEVKFLTALSGAWNDCHNHSTAFTFAHGVHV